MKPHLLILAYMISALSGYAQSSTSAVLPVNNIVINGGFETGFEGWQGTFGYVNEMVHGSPVPTFEGTNSGVVISVDSSSVGQPMWQLLNTTPGTHYLFTFSMLSGFGIAGEQSQGNTGAPVNVWWGGDLFGAGGQYLGVFQNASTTTWATYSFNVVANDKATLIQFVDFRDHHYQLIDAISVVPVPEPATTSLVLAGLIAFGLYRFRSQPFRATSSPRSYSADGR